MLLLGLISLVCWLLKYLYISVYQQPILLVLLVVLNDKLLDLFVQIVEFDLVRVLALV